MATDLDVRLDNIDQRLTSDLANMTSSFAAMVFGSPSALGILALLVPYTQFVCFVLE